MKVREVKVYGDCNPKFVFERDWAPDEVGSLAVEMAIKWGMICATPDGEDSSGRAKMRPLTPEELAVRVVDCAQALTDELRKRGLVLDADTHNEELRGGHD